MKNKLQDVVVVVVVMMVVVEVVLAMTRMKPKMKNETEDLNLCCYAMCCDFVPLQRE